MATPYLIEKWRKVFKLFDIDKNNVLSVEDAYRFADNAIKGGQLKGQAADDYRSKYVNVFKNFYLGTDAETEESLVTRWRKEYNENKSQYEDKVKETFTVYVSLTDLKGDGKISMKEYRAQLGAMGLESFGEKFFNAYPLDEDGTIPSEVLFKGLCEYYYNADETTVSKAEKATCNGFGVNVNI